MFERLVSKTAIRAHLALALLAAIAVGQSTSSMQSMTGEHAHPWAMKHGDAARTGQSSFPGATQGVIAWQYKAPGFVPGLVVAEDGTIITSNVYANGFDYVLAVTRFGKLKWKTKVDSYASGLQGVYGFPALDQHGDAVVPAASSELIKLTRAGFELWQLPLSQGFYNSSSPAVLGNGVVVHYQQGFGLFAASADGAKLWHNPTSFTYQDCCVAVGPHGEMAIGGIWTIEPHGSGDLYYLAADGTLVWSKTSTHGAQNTPMFGPDGTLYANIAGSLSALRADATTLWTADPGYGAPALGKNAQLYTIAATRDAVRAINPATGAILWTTSIGDGRVLDGLAIDATDVIHLTTDLGHAIALSPAGAMLWNLAVCDEFFAGPAIGRDANIITTGYVGPWYKAKYLVFSIE